MKKTKIEKKMLDDYDFSKGVRGKYSERYAKRTKAIKINRAEYMDSDTMAIIDRALTGKALDPKIASRVLLKAEKQRLRILEKQGVVDIAVPAIRQLRGKLPTS